MIERELDLQLVEIDDIEARTSFGSYPLGSNAKRLWIYRSSR